MLDPLTYPLGHMYRVHAVGVGRHMELNMVILDPANRFITLSPHPQIQTKYSDGKAYFKYYQHRSKLTTYVNR